MSGTWYRVGQAAEYLGVSDSALRLWDVNGSFRPERVLPSGRRMYSQEQLDSMAQRMMMEASGSKMRKGIRRM